MSKKKSAKLSDVAIAAGVALGTASNAFNKPDLVKPELREKIEKAARKLGYAGPDPKGRLLMGGKAHAIGFVPAGEMSVATSLRNPYLRHLLSGIADECDQNGANLVIVSGATGTKEWAIRNALVDGFILGHSSEIDLAAVRLRKVPYVIMDVDVGPRVNSVTIDGFAGARMAARHLLELGHRKLAILAVMRRNADPVFYPPGSKNQQQQAIYPFDQTKLLGYADALSEFGIALHDIPIVECYPSGNGPELGAHLLFESAPGFTAVLAMSDRNALAMLKVARERGISVPNDLSVIGFDDLPEAAMADPPLTTIAQPILEKGSLAARMIFENDAARQVSLPVTLIKRGSTAQPGS